MKSKILKATLQIARASGGQADEKPMHITVTDTLSGSRVCELYMRLDEFAKALTASQGEADMEYYSNAPIGMKSETKTEIVPFDMHKLGFGYGQDAIRKNKKLLTEALEGFEVDGWKARRSDMTNHHCRAGNVGQKVVFFRHVNPETGKPVK